MQRKIDEKNARAAEVNPEKSGIRTGNPQLEPHEGDEVRSEPRQRAPRAEPGKAGADEKPGKR